MIATIERIWSLLLPFQRRRAFFVLGLMLIMPVVELAGIGSIFTFVRSVADPGLLEQSGWLPRIRQWTGLESTHEVLVLLGIGTLAVLVARNAVAAFNVWLRTRFSCMTSHELSVRLMRSYLAQPILFFAATNTASLSKNVLTETSQLVSGFLMAVLTIVSDSAMIVAIVGFLMWYDPVITVVAFGALGGTYGLIYLAVRGVVSRLGRQRMACQDDRFRTASQGFSGIKEIKLLGCESYFLNQFAQASRNFWRVLIKNSLIGQLPRYALETLVFGGAVLLVLLKLRSGEGLAQIIGLVTLYGVAVYRLMPSLDGLLKQFASLRFSAPVIDTLEEHLRDALHARAVDGDRGESLPFDRAIQLDSVTFRYPNSSALVLDNLSVTIPKNRTIAFVGPTGVGKSTLVDIVLGLLAPDAGKLTVDGAPVNSENLRAWQNSIGYVPQDIYLYDDTLVRNIAFGRDERDIDRDAVIAAAKLAHLHDFVEAELPDGYETVVGERGIRLSGGQRQRVGIARALYYNPKVLVLDEATSSLDGITERIVTDAIQRLSGEMTIIVIAHRLSTIRHCDTIHLMRAGKIVAEGTYDELMAENATFRAMARAVD